MLRRQRNRTVGGNAERRSGAHEPIVLELADVTKRYGNVVAVDDVSLQLAKGEFLSLLGPSGSGKTTTLQMIAGLAQPSAGEILLAGPADRAVAALQARHRHGVSELRAISRT